MKQRYDLDLFRKLVSQSKTKEEIIDEMGIKNVASYQSLKLRLYEADGKVYTIAGEGPRKEVRKVKMGKNRTITLSSLMLQGSTFKPKDSFSVSIEKNKIVLVREKD